jgi:hypothetical protein
VINISCKNLFRNRAKISMFKPNTFLKYLLYTFLF